VVVFTDQNVTVLASDWGNIVSKRNEEKATLERAAAEGDPGAMLNLGSLSVVEGDVDDARTWWEQAAAAGNTSAMYNLGNLAEGEGDVDDARTWWEQAAATGHPGAMLNLGVLAEGEGDVVGARDWWEQAAATGHPGAMYKLGNLAEGEGEGDVVGARDWYERAAAEGHLDAMFNLGNLAAGEGDVAGARDWWERAAEEGDTEAGTELKRLIEFTEHVKVEREGLDRAIANTPFGNKCEIMANLLILYREEARDNNYENWIKLFNAEETGFTLAFAVHTDMVILKETGEELILQAWDTLCEFIGADINVEYSNLEDMVSSVEKAKS